MQNIALAFFTAFTLTYFAIPSIIEIAQKKNLCDEPGERRSHTVSTPSLGGVGIFAGFIFSFVLWAPFETYNYVHYILCALLIIFLIGMRDDILPLSPTAKFGAQILAASIVVFKSGIFINTFYGLFGIYELPLSLAYLFSVIVIVLFINSFNLIDGINGLTGGIGVLVCSVAGIWFVLVGDQLFSILCFALAGALAAFLRYNLTPAQIFMGDTGSMTVGLVGAIICIHMMSSNASLPEGATYKFNSTPAVIVGICILPIFDTLRVFLIRTMRGQSPFKPDRRHIHHLLIDTGFSHMQATSILLVFNLLFIGIVFYFNDIGALFLLLLIFSLASLLTMLLKRMQSRRILRNEKNLGHN